MNLDHKPGSLFIIPFHIDPSIKQLQNIPYDKQAESLAPLLRLSLFRGVKRLENLSLQLCRYPCSVICKCDLQISNCKIPG